MRSYLRFASVVGALTVSAIAVAPAVAAAPLSQAGANAVTSEVADNEQGTGHATATNEQRSRRRPERPPRLPAPATRPTSPVASWPRRRLPSPASPPRARGSPATAGQCSTSATRTASPRATPSRAPWPTSTSVTWSRAVGAAIVSQSPAELVTSWTDPRPARQELERAHGPDRRGAGPGQGAVRRRRTDADLDMIEGRCTAGDGGPTGTSTIAKARLLLKLPDGTELVLRRSLQAPGLHPPPNTHVFTNLERRPRLRPRRGAQRPRRVLPGPGCRPGRRARPDRGPGRRQRQDAGPRTSSGRWSRTSSTSRSTGRRPSDDADSINVRRPQRGCPAARGAARQPAGEPADRQRRLRTHRAGRRSGGRT